MGHHNLQILIKSTDFEPVQEGSAQSPPAPELENYEEYSRQELPRIFRQVLEAEVSEMAQPIEACLRNRLVAMIQECQDHVFSNYRSSLSPNMSTHLPHIGSAACQILQSTSLSSAGSEEPPSAGTAKIPEDHPTDTLEVQRSPYQDSSRSIPHSMLLESTAWVAEHNESSDSGYISNPSVVDVCSQDTRGIFALRTSTWPHSQVEPQPQMSSSNAQPTQTFTSLIPNEENTDNETLPPAMNDNGLFSMDEFCELDEVDQNEFLDWEHFHNHVG
jgi:hypothetical protein